MRIEAIEFQLGSRVEGLSDLSDDNPEWQTDRLFAKTGVERRHLLASNETPLRLAEGACNRLFQQTGKRKVGGLIYVTQSPESTIPTTACLLHETLGLKEACLAFDLNQGCSGFVYGLSVASGLIKSQAIDSCLVVCAEGYSRYISPHDRTCRPIFSDGASAALVVDDGEGDIGPFVFATDGSGAPNLTLLQKAENDGSSRQVLHMNGPKVLDFTMEAVPKYVCELLHRSSLSVEDVDLFIFHQASKVVLDRVARKLSLGEEKIFRNYREVGNTVSATIPVAMKEALGAEVLRSGMTVVLMGFGVGYSLAGCILRT
jgi:3-oxoacyl-[acyl-carrier-protein] synthase-3